MARSVTSRFAYGPYGFEVTGSNWGLSGDLANLVRVWDDHVGRVVKVGVEIRPELDESANVRQVTYDWQGRHASAKTGRVTAELHETDTHVNVTASLACADAASALITLVTGALIHNEGGLVLHASGITYGHGAVLFVGPSGAGKTTTANQCKDGFWFAKDRAGALPSHSGWIVFGMAGGDPINLRSASHIPRPLTHIYRVVRATENTLVEDVSPAVGMGIVLESSQSGAPHIQSLDAAQHLLRSVRVARLHVSIAGGVQHLFVGAPNHPRAP